MYSITWGLSNCMRGVCILCEKYKYFCIFVTPVIHKYSPMANIQNFTLDFAFSAASIKNFTFDISIKNITFDFVFQHQACLSSISPSSDTQAWPFLVTSRSPSATYQYCNFLSPPLHKQHTLVNAGTFMGQHNQTHSPRHDWCCLYFAS